MLLGANQDTPVRELELPNPATQVYLPDGGCLGEGCRGCRDVYPRICSAPLPPAPLHLPRLSPWHQKSSRPSRPCNRIPCAASNYGHGRAPGGGGRSACTRRAPAHSMTHVFAVGPPLPDSWQPPSTIYGPSPHRGRSSAAALRSARLGSSCARRAWCASGLCSTASCCPPQRPSWSRRRWGGWGRAAAAGAMRRWL